MTIIVIAASNPAITAGTVPVARSTTIAPTITSASFVINAVAKTFAGLASLVFLRLISSSRI